MIKIGIISKEEILFLKRKASIWLTSYRKAAQKLLQIPFVATMKQSEDTNGLEAGIILFNLVAFKPIIVVRNTEISFI